MGKFLLRHTNNSNYSTIYTVVWCGMFVWVNSFSDILITIIIVPYTVYTLVWADVSCNSFPGLQWVDMILYDRLQNKD